MSLVWSSASLQAVIAPVKVRLHGLKHSSGFRTFCRSTSAKRLGDPILVHGGIKQRTSARIVHLLLRARLSLRILWPYPQSTPTPPCPCRKHARDRNKRATAIRSLSYGGMSPDPTALNRFCIEYFWFGILMQRGMAVLGTSEHRTGHVLWHSKVPNTIAFRSLNLGETATVLDTLQVQAYASPRCQALDSLSPVHLRLPVAEARAAVRRV